jgi:O-antigen/teichoic acid export membrane protein
VAVLATGTALGQALIVLASPVLSRLYDPTAFGALAVIMAIASPIAQLGTLKYEYGIVLAKRFEEAANLAVLSVGFAISTTLISAACVFAAGDWIAGAFDASISAPLLFFAPGIALIVGLSNVLNSWANRKKSYKVIASSHIVNSACTVFIQITMGLLDAAAKGLVLGRTVGLAFGLGVLAFDARRQWSSIFSSLSFKSLKSAARQHSQFPKYSMPRELLVALSGSATPILIALALSPASAGLYWFARRLLEAPKTMISTSVRRVFYRTAASLHHDNQSLLPILTKTTFYLAAIAILPTAVIVLFGPDIFDFVFGAEWRKAGIYAQWLIVWWMSSFCLVPATALAPILELQRGVLIIEIIGLGLRLGGLCVGILLADDVLAIASYSIAGLLVNLGRQAYVFHHTIQRSKPTRSTTTMTTSSTPALKPRE